MKWSTKSVLLQNQNCGTDVIVGIVLDDLGGIDAPDKIIRRDDMRREPAESMLRYAGVVVPHEAPDLI
jgi:hypothetical protein